MICGTHKQNIVRFSIDYIVPTYLHYYLQSLLGKKIIDKTRYYDIYYKTKLIYVHIGKLL